jgi:hypothetical protein
MKGSKSPPPKLILEEVVEKAGISAKDSSNSWHVIYAIHNATRNKRCSQREFLSKLLQK